MTYNERSWLQNALQGVESRVRDLRYQIKVCCDDPGHLVEHDWPVDYPAAVDLSTPFNALLDALNTMERGVIETERKYREDVLRWLLAETEAKR